MYEQLWQEMSKHSHAKKNRFLLEGSEGPVSNISFVSPRRRRSRRRRRAKTIKSEKGEGEDSSQKDFEAPPQQAEGLTSKASSGQWL